MKKTTRNYPVSETPLSTVTEVAKRFAVAERTVRRWIADGRLEALRLGRAVRIEEAAIDDFLSDARRERR